MSLENFSLKSLRQNKMFLKVHLPTSAKGVYGSMPVPIHLFNEHLLQGATGLSKLPHSEQRGFTSASEWRGRPLPNQLIQSTFHLNIFCDCF